MAKVKYVTQDTYDPDTALGYETSHLFPSVTVPGEAWSIQELLERHMAGLLTDTEISREGTFATEDPDFDDPDLEKMMHADLVEQQEFASEGRRAIEEVRAAQQKKAQAEADAAEAARIEALVQERLAKEKGGPTA